MADKGIVMETEEKEVISRNPIEQGTNKDLVKGVYDRVQTRFPPKPNSYSHIGHVKSILLSCGLAQKYSGKFNLHFGDTNPTREKTEFVESAIDDTKWLGADFGDRFFFTSDYFDQIYERAVPLIRKGKAFICDPTAGQIREYREGLIIPGKENLYKNRSVEENLALFREVKEGKHQGGERVLRAKTDMVPPNINTRDPAIYHAARMSHHNTGDKRRIYPMYDFAHSIGDVAEYIAHPIYTLEFEDHGSLHDWVVKERELKNSPCQIKFAKLYLTNVITGRRHIKKLVEDSIVNGWDDSRLVSIVALRRRGHTPEAIEIFMGMVGVSKTNSSADYTMLEYCIREDLELRKPCMVAILNPVRLVTDSHSEEQVEMLDVPSNLENSGLGDRKVPFGWELYAEREDSTGEPPKKYFRMSPGSEVRLVGAYFVKYTGCERDANGNTTAIHSTYDPKTESGSGFKGRKIKGTIHRVAASIVRQAECRLYENIMDEEKGKLSEDGSLSLDPNSLAALKGCYAKPILAEGEAYDSYQFVCSGFFHVDCKDSTPQESIFSRTVSLKSSFKLPKQDESQGNNR